MPIRINFLAEQQEAEVMRRRDPVKLSIKVAMVLVVLVLGYCGWMQYNVSLAKADLAAREAEYDKLSKGEKLVNETFKKITETERKLTALASYATNRPLWGTALNALQQSVVDDVEVSHFRVSQQYALTDEVKPRMVGTVKIPGKPATSTEKIVLILDVKDYADQSKQNYNTFKESLASNPFFKQNLVTENPVRLKGLSPPQSGAANPGKMFVVVTLECYYPEKVR